MTQSVLLTGANGFIGRALADKLHKDGWAIKAPVRKYPTQPCEGVDYCVVGSLANAGQGSIASAADGVTLAIHAAGVSPLGSHEDVLAESSAMTHAVVGAILAKRIPRVLLVSSIAASIAESGDQNARLYGFQKLEVELQFISRLAGAAALLIVRPPPVYGPGMHGPLGALVSAVRMRVPLPLGLATEGRYYLSRSNLVDLLARLAGADAEPWRVLSQQPIEPHDGCAVSAAEFSRAIARALEVKAHLVPVPPWLLKFVGMLLGRQELVSGALDAFAAEGNARLSQTIDWTPPTPFPQTLEFLGTVAQA